MVVNAIAEPYLFEIFLKSLEVFGITVSIVAGIDLFKEATELEIILAILIPDDVASHLRSLRQIVKHLFLIKRETGIFRHFIAEHFDVGKAIHMEIKIFVFYCIRS